MWAPSGSRKAIGWHIHKHHAYTQRPCIEAIATLAILMCGVAPEAYNHFQEAMHLEGLIGTAALYQA